MTLTRTTPALAGAYATSLAGRSRDELPVPWTADPGIDDCARFCSHVIWGGKPGPISWVDNFKSAGDGSYAAGAGDLEPWDVILFDWEGNGVGNHVEFMVADLGNGYVRTFGANGSDTRAAAYRLRPKSYILGRFRPAWVTAAATLNHTTPKATRRFRMFTIVPVTNNPKVAARAKYVVGLTGKRAPIKSKADEALLIRARDNAGADTMLDAELDIVAGYLKRVN